MLDDLSPRHSRIVDALEMLRTLLRELELSKQLSADMYEQVRETRLRTDREIEALRRT